MKNATFAVFLAVVSLKPGEHLHAQTPPQLVNERPIVAPYTATTTHALYVIENKGCILAGVRLVPFRAECEAATARASTIAA
jgi:hypothetical protein